MSETIKVQVKCEKPKFTAYFYLNPTTLRCVKISNKLPEIFVGMSLNWIKSYSRGRGFELKEM